MDGEGIVKKEKSPKVKLVVYDRHGRKERQEEGGTRGPGRLELGDQKMNEGPSSPKSLWHVR